MIKDYESLEKYNEIWEKVKNGIKKEFDCEPVYNEKYLKAKIKSSKGKIKTNFHNDKTPKKGSNFICLSAILIILLLEQVQIGTSSVSRRIKICWQRKKDAWV